MTLHFGERFDKQVIEMDGQVFDACTFVGCQLFYRGGDPPGLANNTLISCQFHLRDAAARTAAFFREMYACGGKDWANEWIAPSEGRELPSSPEGPLQ